jgi:hypothetical protein
LYRKHLRYGTTYSALLVWMEKNNKNHALAAIAKGKQKIIPSAYEAGWAQHPPGLRRGREIHTASRN